MADLEALCRACLQREGKISLFTEVNNVTMAQRMLECVSLKLEQICSPPRPDKVCEECAGMLRDYQTFRRQCWSCDARIRSWTINPGDNQNTESFGSSEDSSKKTTRNSAESFDVKSQISKLNLKISKSVGRTKIPKASESQSDDWDEMEVPLNTLAKLQKENNGAEQNITNSKEEKKEKKIKSKDKKKTVRKKFKKESVEIDYLTGKQVEKSEVQELELPKRDKEIKELYFPDEVPFTVTRKQKKKRRLTRYMCEACGYRANDAHSLRVHTRFHTGERPHACTLCTKRFVVAVALKAHMQRHSGRPACVCEQCGRGLSSAAGLRAHRRAHDAPRAHACTLCPRRFTLRANLNAHQRTHTGHRPHHCEFPGCGKAFSTSSDLKGHWRVHSGERPFACLSCPKRFSLRSNLLVHQRTHSGSRDFICPECGKAFLHKSSLKSHARVHSGVRDHVCATCAARFAHSNSLRAHMHTHSDTRLKECPVCHKRFTRQATLNAHVKRHKSSDVVQAPTDNNNIPTTSTATSGDTNQYILPAGNTEPPRNSVIEKQTNGKITILNSRIVRSTVQDFATIATGNIQILQMKNNDRVVNLSVANTQDSAHKSVERTNVSSFKIASAFRSNPQVNNTFKTNINVLNINSNFDTTLQQTCISQSKIAPTNNIEVSHNDNNRVLNLDNGIVLNDSRRDSNVIGRGLNNNNNIGVSHNRVLNLDNGIVSNDSQRDSNVIGRGLINNLRDSCVSLARNDAERVSNDSWRVSNVVGKVLNDNVRDLYVENDRQKVLNDNFRLMPISKDNCANLRGDHNTNVPRISSSDYFRGITRSFGSSDATGDAKMVSNESENSLIDNGRVENTYK